MFRSEGHWNSEIISSGRFSPPSSLGCDIYGYTNEFLIILNELIFFNGRFLCRNIGKYNPQTDVFWGLQCFRVKRTWDQKV